MPGDCHSDALWGSGLHSMASGRHGKHGNISMSFRHERGNPASLSTAGYVSHCARFHPNLHTRQTAPSEVEKP